MSEYTTSDEALEHADYLQDRYIFDYEYGFVIDTESGNIVSQSSIII